MHAIQYKTKVRQVHVDDHGTLAPYIDFKRKLTRHDCNLKPCDHAYYNSDLFPAILNGYYQKIVKSKDWSLLSQLPEGVSVDTSKFLAVVTIELPLNFR